MSPVSYETSIFVPSVEFRVTKARKSIRVSIKNCCIKRIISKFKKKNIRTSLFVDPNLNDIEIAKDLDVDCVELHTGKISDLVKNNKNYNYEYKKIKKCCVLAKKLKLEVHAGHGLDYKTTEILSKLKEIEEFNIGHFIIGESIVHGLKKTIKKFKKISNK